MSSALVRTVQPSIAGFALACLTSLPVMARAPQAADLVLRGGKVVTVDENRPEAQAIAIAAGRILAVGSDEEIAAHIGEETEVIELEGMLAIPGFIEGHGHFLGIGDARMQLDLMHVANWDEVVAMVASAAKQARPGELIRGRGWHQEKWSETPVPNVDGVPLHASLSAVSPDNPVLLTHASGHATFANKRAMELAGVDRSTPDPEGGQIVRDGAGEPSGLFRETAAGLLGRARSGARRPDQRRMAELASAECLSKGITSFQDAGSSFGSVDLFRSMAAEGSLGVRLWVMLRVSNGALAERMQDYRIIDEGDHHLTVRAIKRSIDGALGSHGAWLLEPYRDLPESRGLNTTTPEDVAVTAALAAEHGFQLCVHAIGDRANREVLDIFEAAFAKQPEGADLRWRIEHAQHLSIADIPRFAKLGVIASMQGVHCTSDGPWVYARLGDERAQEGAYVWQKLLQSGAVVTNGTDAPVEDVDPIASFHATVTRRLEDGSIFFGDQRMSRLEALRSYTLSCAYAAFEEQSKGSLTPGKLADVTVLTRDILSVPADEILDAKVRYTIVGGEVLYSSEPPKKPTDGATGEPDRKQGGDEGGGR